MKTAMYAIIRKDIRSISSNKNLFASLLLVPLILTVLVPTIFVLTVHFAPNDPDMQNLAALLPPGMEGKNFELTLLGLVLNYLLPVFFLVIPIMASSIMAATSFVGEKEKHTLETLLYCPLTLGQIFRAKVAASFLLSMVVSAISFAAMLLVLEGESYFLLGQFLLPSFSWALILLLLSPSLSLIGVTLIVRGSAKAQSVEQSQQSAVFLVLPVVLLFVSQVTGVMLLSPWILLALGVFCAALAWLLVKKALRRFTYEMLLDESRSK